MWCAVLANLYCSSAWANISDPFEKATTKTAELTGYLMGDVAVAICGVVIAISGIALMFNKLSWGWFIRIAGGALIIGSATGIATWLMSTGA